MRRLSDADPGRYRLPWTSVVLVIVIGLTQAAALAVFIVLTRQVLEVLVPGDVGAALERSHEEALRLTGLLALIGVALGLLRAAEFSIAEKAGYEVVRRLRMDMYEHLTRMMPHHLRHRARGGLLLRLTGDLSMLRMWLSRGLLQGTVALIVLVVGVVATMWLNAWMALALVSSYALLVAVSVANGRVMREATRRMRRRRSLVIGNIDEQINSLAVVQTAGRVSGEYSRLSRQNDSLTRALGRVAELRGRLRGLATAGTHLATAAVLAIGIAEVRRGATDVATVLTCVVITRFLSRPVRTLGLANDYWHRGQVSRQKIDEFLRSSAREPDGEDVQPFRVPRGALEFENVSVPGLLDPLTAEVPPRTVLGVTGDSTAAGSALVALLARTLEPVSGQIRVDGVDLQSTAWVSAGRRFGVVAPDLPLMRGTIRRNLTYRAPDASPEEIQRVVFALGLEDLVERHRGEGVRGWLTEGGGNLGPGDRRLLQLGRAMMDNPRLLLLDQPTAGLDDASAAQVRQALSRYQGTVVLVSSDPADLEMADVVWVMEGGRLVDIVDGIDHQARLWAREHRGGVACRRVPVP